MYIDFKGLIYCMPGHCNRFRNIETSARFSLVCDIFLFEKGKGAVMPRRKGCIWYDGQPSRTDIDELKCA